MVQHTSHGTEKRPRTERAPLTTGRPVRFAAALGAAALVAALLPTPPASADVPVGQTVRIEGINTAPAMRGWLSSAAQIDSWYDSTSGQSLLNADVVKLVDLGVRHVRIEIPWALIESTQGTYSWTRMDAILTAMRDNAITVQAAISFTPAWAQTGGNTPEAVRSTGGRTGYIWSQIPSGNSYPTFVTAVAQRFKNNFPGVVDQIEIWNEPDLYYWAGSAADYSNVLLEPGYAAIKAVDPNFKVVMGPATVNLGWLNDVKNAGGLNSFDILAHHYYGDSTTDLQNLYNSASGWMSSNGIASRPLQLDEFGGSSGANSALIQYAYTSSALGYSKAQIYNLRDDNDTYYDGSISYYGDWGLLEYGGTTEKAQYTLFKSLLATSNGAVINDNTVGTGTNQFNYTGSWGYSTTDSNAYLGDTHWTNTNNNKYEVSFNGTSVQIFATKGTANGIMAVSIDGGTETLVDTYAATRQDQVLLYTSPTLASGTHTVSVRVTNQKNALSTNYYVQADKLVIA